MGGIYTYASSVPACSSCHVMTFSLYHLCKIRVAVFVLLGQTTTKVVMFRRFVCKAVQSTSQRWSGGSTDQLWSAMCQGLTVLFAWGIKIIYVFFLIPSEVFSHHVPCVLSFYLSSVNCCKQTVTLSLLCRARIFTTPTPNALCSLDFTLHTIVWIHSQKHVMIVSTYVTLNDIIFFFCQRYSTCV